MGSPLPAGERALVQVSAALASRDAGEVRRALKEARGAAADVEIEEALLQSCLFLGYPAALGGLAQWRAIGGDAGAGSAAEDAALWARRGEEICEALHGDQCGPLRDNLRGLHPEMERWVVAEGYGKILGRPRLRLRVRELCVVALLAILGAPAQLHSHLRAALNLGASEAAVRESLRIAEAYMNHDQARGAAELWGRVRARFRARNPARRREP